MGAATGAVGARRKRYVVAIGTIPARATDTASPTGAVAPHCATRHDRHGADTVLPWTN